MKAGALLQVWRHTTQSADGALILPDGCVDLIGYQPPGERPRWKLSLLIDRACQVPSQVGQRYAGYRLQPGARVNAAELLKAIEGLEVDDTPGALERLDEATNMDDGVWEALQALASERDLPGTQRQLGVSERSLQRLIGAATGRPPLYWKRLARLRQAARALGGCEPLAHVAADQAHMNLEFQRWLGFTPARSGAAANLAARPAERGRVRVKSTLAQWSWRLASLH